MNDLLIEKKYVQPDSSVPDGWFEIMFVERELRRLEGYYQDPGLLMYAGSRFRTPWAFYRVSSRRTREAVLAGTLEARN